MLLHSCTLTARSTPAILSYTSRLFEKFAGHPLLFTISANAGERDLSQLHKEISVHSIPSVGCLSAPVTTNPALISCSLAFFDSQYATIFRSEIPGRNAPQVGRWHTNRKKEPEKSPSIEFLNRGFQSRWSLQEKMVPLPSPLQDIG
jgi:hypothetical protein